MIFTAKRTTKALTDALQDANVKGKYSTVVKAMGNWPDSPAAEKFMRHEISVNMNVAFDTELPNGANTTALLLIDGTDLAEEALHALSGAVAAFKQKCNNNCIHCAIIRCSAFSGETDGKISERYLIVSDFDVSDSLVANAWDACLLRHGESVRMDVAISAAAKLLLERPEKNKHLILLGSKGLTAGLTTPMSSSSAKAQKSFFDAVKKVTNAGVDFHYIALENGEGRLGVQDAIQNLREVGAQADILAGSKRQGRICEEDAPKLMWLLLKSLKPVVRESADAKADGRSGLTLENKALSADNAVEVTVTEGKTGETVTMLVSQEVYTNRSKKYFASTMTQITRASEGKDFSCPSLKVIVAKAADAAFPYNWRFASKRASDSIIIR